MEERDSVRAGAAPAGDDASTDVIAAAWPRALPVLLERVAAIEDAIAALLGGSLQDPQRAAARREAHRLAGALGALGVAPGSVIARELEGRLETAPAVATAPELAARVLALRRAIESGPADSGAQPRVVLAGLSGARAGGLLRAAADRDWRLTAAPTAPEAPEADAVLLDSGLPQLNDAISRLAGAGVAVAVLVVDEVDRVGLVRAGARRLVPTDLGPDAIVAELDGLVAGAPVASGTILALDDDPVTLAIVRATLADTGLEVATCSHPAELWSALERSAPDLVVLDVQLPDADGTQLCRALRADSRWRALPVLFLTAETGAAKVAELFAAGGDDYVPKPVQPAELVARVAGRLERTDQTRDRADLDRISGLPLRAAAEPQLERLVAIAGRLGHSLCIVAIAVDRYAQLAPDDRERALAAAGLAATASIRAGDLGAAWGEDELILGMLGADANEASAIVADALTAARGASARPTISAGVAEHPRDGDQLAALVAAASTARRAAEAAGGDRVAIAGAPAGGIERVDVALVEDDEVLAQLILDGLHTRGYRTRWISDGDEATDLLGGERPALRADLVLLDWDLPSRDGLTVLRELSGDGILAATRVVMLTARASQREILATLELGATEHVAKPFSLAVLMRRVQTVLGR